MAMILTSQAFREGEAIPPRHSRQGGNISPDLAWTGAPENTQSFALIVDDPDAPGGDFVHWVLFDIQATVDHLPEGVPQHERPQGIGVQGRNGFGELGYSGPQPPPGKPHHYRFTLYALDVPRLRVPPGATKAHVLDQMKGHILGQARLIGTFQHAASQRTGAAR
jgi:Raf kinase inhibitor-like YbhB/YbcL family protein